MRPVLKIIPPDVRHLHLPLLYKDREIVVVDKPAGLLSVPGNHVSVKDSVLERICALFPEAQGSLIAHRLDMATSGLMVLGLTVESHRGLSIQFQERQVAKRYEAVIEGIPAERSGRISLAFRKDFENKPRQILDAVHGRMGISDWSVLEVEGGRARLELTPLTGRTHQLRLHTSHELGLGIPIVGDLLYGDGKEGERLLLHARDLTFQHPRTEKRLTFHAPVPF